MVTRRVGDGRYWRFRFGDGAEDRDPWGGSVRSGVTQRNLRTWSWRGRSFGLGSVTELENDRPTGVRHQTRDYLPNLLHRVHCTSRDSGLLIRSHKPLLNIRIKIIVATGEEKWVQRSVDEQERRTGDLVTP